MIRVAIFADSASLARKVAKLLAEDNQIEIVEAGDEALADVVVAAAAAVGNFPKEIIPHSPAKEADDEFLDRLTRRELEVLRMLADGLENKEIARLLGISDHTAKFHVAQILAKLGSGSRTEAVMTAIRRGLIPI